MQVSNTLKEKTVAIVQSNYIPWKGYFDMINLVDEFILYDDAQYTKRDWRNRNKIKTPNGLYWLTIPVLVKGKYYQKIKEVQISDIGWASKHWSIIRENYSKSKYFQSYSDILGDLYLNCKERYLSDINYNFIMAINKILNIKTKIKFSMNYDICDGSNSEKLLSLAKQANADVYLSGPRARDYLDVKLFKESGVKVEWMNYDKYPVYYQNYGVFEHKVSILDLIFNEGDGSKFLFNDRS